MLHHCLRECSVHVFAVAICAKSESRFPPLGDVGTTTYLETSISNCRPMSQRLYGSLIAYGLLAMVLLPIVITIQAIPGI